MTANQRLQEQRDEAQALVTAWQNVFGSIEAHLRDRIAMGDAAEPERYLWLIQSDVENVLHESKQIVAARWADHARATAENGRLQGIIRELLGVLEKCPLPSTMGSVADHYTRFYDWYQKVAVPAIRMAGGVA